MTAVRLMKKHISGYTKGLPDSSEFRDRFNRIERAEEALEAIRAYFGALKKADVAA
jgi:tRNA-dihydrouridine synthase